MKKRKNNKKVIAFIIDPINLSTGSFKSTIRNISFLTERGYKAIVITDNSPSSKKAEFPSKSKVYRVKSKPLFFDKNQWLALPTRSELRNIFVNENVEIVHLIMPTISALKAASIAKKLNLKIVSHSHTQPENFRPFIPKFLWQICRFLFYKYLVYYYSKANIIICPSKFSEELLKEQNSLLNTVVISNGVDIKLFNFSKNKNNGQFNLLFVGRLDPEKDVLTLIKAFHQLTKEYGNIKLNLVGNGVQKNDINGLIKELNLSKQVNLLGRITEKELIKNYQKADIFVLPSLVELEGMVVLEAMACGNPIMLANSKDSAARFFADGNGFLFEPGNSEDLANKIKQLLNNRSLRKEMSLKSREIAEKYDIKRSIKKLEKIYDSV